MADFFLILVPKKAGTLTGAKCIKIWRNILGKKAELSIIPTRPVDPLSRKEEMWARIRPTVKTQ